jgi:hypothetical protein
MAMEGLHQGVQQPMHLIIGGLLLAKRLNSQNTDGEVINPQIKDQTAGTYMKGTM